MSARNIRLSSTLTFDEQQEADIIKIIDDFNSSHKMGEFLSHLIRIAFENPEIVECKNDKCESGKLIKVMEKLGKSPTRHEYMQVVNKRLADMQAKVDQMYDMCLKLYTMTEVGKRLGLEKRVENQVLAEFVIEQQLEQLKRIVGGEMTNVAFASNRMTQVSTKANEYLDYIVSCYEPIINELKKEIQVKPVEIQMPVTPVAPVSPVTPVTPVATVAPVASPVAPVASPVAPVTNKQLNIQPQPLIVGDDNVDFSNADYGALSDFFGD